MQCPRGKLLLVEVGEIACQAFVRAVPGAGLAGQVAVLALEQRRVKIGIVVAGLKT